MTETKPKRRWFRFGLRTMFVMVTVFGIWLGLEVRNVRQRAEMLKWLDERPPVSAPWVMPDYGVEQNDKNRWRYQIDDSKLSWIRWLLGDHFVVHIDRPWTVAPEEVDRLQKLFPESYIMEWNGPVG